MGENLTVAELRGLLKGVPDDALVGAFIDGDPQGHAVMTGENFNDRENIFWVRVGGHS